MPCCGGAEAQIPSERLKLYVECTYLSEKEILSVLEIFQEISVDKGNATWNRGFVNDEAMARIPELTNNPFRHQFTRVFSEDHKGEDKLTFDELVHLYSAMSARSSAEDKCKVAYHLFDFDGDGMIGADDLRKVCCAVLGWPWRGSEHLELPGTPRALSQDLIQMRLGSTDKKNKTWFNQKTGKRIKFGLEHNIFDAIVKETNMQNEELSYSQFKKVISLYPDFLGNFNMSIKMPAPQGGKKGCMPCGGGKKSKKVGVADNAARP